MQRRNGQLLFSPSDLNRYLESPFVSWMDRLHLEMPGTVVPDEDSETNKLLQKKGLDHEYRFLQELRNQGKDVIDVSPAPDQFAATLTAMQAGHDVIYQGALSDGQFAGYSDFLIKTEGQSNFGAYSYEPWDTKLAQKSKTYFLVQLACYADLLRVAQGVLPRRMHVALGNGEIATFRVEDYFYFYLALRQSFLELQNTWRDDNAPDFTGMEDFGRWTSHAEEIIRQKDHLCQIANIRAVQMKKLRAVGIHNMRSLAESQIENVPKLKPATLSTLRNQARLQIESLLLLRPIFELLDPDVELNGLAFLPPASLNDVYFDMEGYPLVPGGLEYLFGATVIENGSPKFLDWWAHTEDEEKAAFAAFMDWVYKRWKDDPSMHIYHYAAYEKSALRKLTGKHAICAFEVDELLRHEVMVDLYAVVKKAIRVGEPRYSLKNIEHLYKEKRKGDVATAVDSIVFYQRWLEEKPNGASDWKDSPILADIRAYNKEDCDSTWQLATWLRDLQKQSGITWKNPNTRSGPDRISESAQQRTRAAELAETLLQKAITAETSESRQLHALIANVMEFHWREAKPVFWARFDRREMSEQELFEDSICLAGLERTSAAPTQCQKSIHYEYSYDPEQETKIDVGDECFYAHDLSETVKVVEIDGDKGHIVLSRSIKRLAPPEKLNLIQNEFVSADEIAQAIYRIGSKLLAGEELPQSLTDFIARRPPRIADWRDGPIVDGACDLVAQTCSVISRLESTTLCIQGPPGSGKTYTASKAIIELLKSGKTVGVTSNSHKAIANLIDAIADKCDASSNVNLRAAKIQSQKKDFHVANARVMAPTPAKLFAAERGTFNLIGGTAWAFCKPEAEAMVDYLFVDEAGQVSIANLVGMSASARNIVLIGDQMQLAQPLKGTHPADSGQSTLEYLLGDRQVIPSDFGIFLGTSFRMHPDICSFISGSVYENRLYPHPSTKERVLILPPASAELAPDFPPAGVFFHPVSHDGNAQDSCEEADAIAKLVSQLLLCSLTDGVTIRPVTKKDILVVAPFNMQVRRLHQTLPEIAVGTVDKFQGQEAPIVIVSMTSSTGDASARGLEFLFSKNRLNVAISRAQTLAVVVGCPELKRTHCRTVEQMELVNLFCRIAQ